MIYDNITMGRFICRPNRFIAKVNINGSEHTVHVKNTGRCKELLVPGAKVFLQESAKPERKTRFDLIAVEKILADGSEMLINMDSQAPNAAAEEWLKKGLIFGKDASIRREVKYGDSRFDFYIEADNRKIFLEVKGVTLENNGIASFPDAPTERGIKHIHELIECRKEGYEAFLLFVIQMKGISAFTADRNIHPEFADALKKASSDGVVILAYDCIINPDSMVIDRPVRIISDP